MRWENGVITHDPLRMCVDVIVFDNVIVRDDANVLDDVCAWNAEKNAFEISVCSKEDTFLVLLL